MDLWHLNFMPECITFEILPHPTRLLSILVLSFIAISSSVLVSHSLFTKQHAANVSETPGASSGS